MKSCSHTQPRPPFSFYRYSGAAAILAWTIGWAVAAYLAGSRLALVQGVAEWGDAMVTTLFAVVGFFWCVRLFRRTSSTNLDDKSANERVTVSGWFATIAWCSFALIWNLATFGTLFRGMRDGKSFVLIFLIPFSVVGQFLLLLLFVVIAMGLDSLRGALSAKKTIA